MTQQHFIAHFKPKFQDNVLVFDSRIDAVFYDPGPSQNKTAIKRIIQKHFKQFLNKPFTHICQDKAVLPTKCCKLLVDYVIQPETKVAEFKYFLLQDNCEI